MKTLDELLEEGRKTLDLEKRKKIYSLVQKISAFDLPYVSLWYHTNVVVMNRMVEGFVLYPAGDFTSLKNVSFPRASLKTPPIKKPVI